MLRRYSIINTKLHRPVLTKDLVKRSDLIQKLEQNQHKPLTLVSAPNGYGGAAWNGYASNALYALENGLSTYGDRSTDPAGYALYVSGDANISGTVNATAFVGDGSGLVNVPGSGKWTGSLIG